MEPHLIPNASNFFVGVDPIDFEIFPDAVNIASEVSGADLLRSQRPWERADATQLFFAPGGVSGFAEMPVIPLGDPSADAVVSVSHTDARVGDLARLTASDTWAAKGALRIEVDTTSGAFATTADRVINEWTPSRSLEIWIKPSLAGNYVLALHDKASFATTSGAFPPTLGDVSLRFGFSASGFFFEVARYSNSAPRQYIPWEDEEGGLVLDHAKVYQVVVAIDDTVDEARVYIDGVLRTTFGVSPYEASAGPPSGAHGETLTIGLHPYEGPEYAGYPEPMFRPQHEFALIRLWRTALSSEEVARIHDRPYLSRARDPDGIALAWLFQETSGNTIGDASGNSYHGTINDPTGSYTWTTVRNLTAPSSGIVCQSSAEPKRDVIRFRNPSSQLRYAGGSDVSNLVRWKLGGWFRFHPHSITDPGLTHNVFHVGSDPADRTDRVASLVLKSDGSLAAKTSMHVGSPVGGTTPASVADGQFRFVEIHVDSEFRLLVDGEVVTTSALPGWAAATDLRIFFGHLNEGGSINSAFFDMGEFVWSAQGGAQSLYKQALVGFHAEADPNIVLHINPRLDELDTGSSPDRVPAYGKFTGYFEATEDAWGVWDRTLDPRFECHPVGVLERARDIVFARSPSGVRTAYYESWRRKASDPALQAGHVGMWRVLEPRIGFSGVSVSRSPSEGDGLSLSVPYLSETEALTIYHHLRSARINGRWVFACAHSGQLSDLVSDRDRHHLSIIGNPQENSETKSVRLARQFPYSQDIAISTHAWS